MLWLYALGEKSMACDIAFLIHDFAASGVVRNAIRLSKHAEAMGLKVAFWVTINQGKLRGDISDTIDIHELAGPFAKSLPRRLADLLIIPALRSKILRERPRLLFSSGNHFHLSAVLAWHLSGKPKGTQFMGRASNAMRGGLLGSIEAWKFSGMKPIIAVSRELADQLEKVGITRTNIDVIANGVDIEATQKASLATIDDEWFSPHAPPVILGAGRLSYQKNFSLLILAFAELRKHMPARLMILGEGPQREALLKQAQGLGLEEDVRLVGHVPNPAAYYARAGLFVLSSRWEGMSNVLIEAMAAGCPVVGVKAPTGTAELLKHGRIGPLVEATPQALAKAMIKRLQAPRDREILIEHARQYELTKMLKAYEKHFLTDRDHRDEPISA